MPATTNSKTKPTKSSTPHSIRHLFLSLAILLASIIISASLLITAFILTAKDFYLEKNSTSTGEIKNNVLKVTGNGTTYVKPDKLNITIRISKTSATSQQALQAVNEDVNQVKKILADNQINNLEVQIVSLNVFTEYDYSIQSPSPTIKGQKAEQVLNFNIKQIDTATYGAKIIDLISSINQIEITGVKFGINEESEPSEDARNKALDDAKNKADQIASKSNLKIIKPISVVDSTKPPFEIYPNTSNTNTSSSLTSISPGQLEVKSQVEVTYLIQN